MPLVSAQVFKIVGMCMHGCTQAHACMGVRMVCACVGVHIHMGGNGL